VRRRLRGTKRGPGALPPLLPPLIATAEADLAPLPIELAITGAPGLPVRLPPGHASCPGCASCASCTGWELQAKGGSLRREEGKLRRRKEAGLFRRAPGGCRSLQPARHACQLAPAGRSACQLAPTWLWHRSPRPAPHLRWRRELPPQVRPVISSPGAPPGLRLGLSLGVCLGLSQGVCLGS